ncbi:MAG: alpha/beta hydrolase [Hyphomicrobiales bacterium]|nr:alpha/beta hydrolase [Hyphomicrobiales bacterium]
MDSGFVRNGAIRLQWRSAGRPDATGPMLLFLHGFPEFSCAWDVMLAHFAPQYFCVAPDLRGFGGSDRPAEVSAYGPGALMSDIAAVIRHFGRDKAIIIAHDWGGAIAWGFAARHAAMVEKLIILNAPHAVPFARALAHDAGQQRASHYMLKLRLPGMEDRLREQDAAALAAMFNHPVDGHNVLPPELLATYRRNWLEPGALEAMLNYYRVTPLLPPTPEHAGAAALQLDPAQFKVQVPVLVIWGMKDQRCCRCCWRASMSWWATCASRGWPGPGIFVRMRRRPVWPP